MPERIERKQHREVGPVCFENGVHGGAKPRETQALRLPQNQGDLGISGTFQYACHNWRRCHALLLNTALSTTPGPVLARPHSSCLA